MTRTITLVILSAFCSSYAAAAETPAKIDFNRDVRPILSNHCWTCHGRDEASRKAGLRLDMRDQAVMKLKSDEHAIVPGKPGESGLVERIEADDDLQMPPASFKKPLTTAQKETLKKWISQGAPFADHWAFIPPKRTGTLPDVKTKDWPRNTIDRFILEKLEEGKLKPSPEADRTTWLRRVTLDLTGLPPTLEERAAFLADQSPTAFENVVNRLLSSPRHAERMAAHWLDSARYADTNGYNNDEVRTLWPWRDWVINAFATNIPYDRFLTEQLAGDLLPGATVGQKVATGFNRNHVLTTEGGIIEAEYQAEYVADRVHTTSTVFLGLSMQCARCHNHKYDPFTQKDYYRFAAFFNNIPDKIVSYSQGRMAEPLLQVPSPEQAARKLQLENRTKELQSLLQSRGGQVDAEMKLWEAGLKKEEIEKAAIPGLAARFKLDDAAGVEIKESVSGRKTGKLEGKFNSTDGRLGKSIEFDGSTFISSLESGIFEADQRLSLATWIFPTSNDASTVLSRMDDANAFRGYDIILEQGRLASHFVNQWPDKAFKVMTKKPLPLNAWHHVLVSYDGSRTAAGVKVYVDGQPQELEIATNNRLEGTLKTDKPFHIGKRHASATFKGRIDEVRLYSEALTPANAAELARGETLGDLKAILATAPEKRSAEETATLKAYYISQVDPSARQWRAELAELPKKLEELNKAIPVTMVMNEMTPRRPTHLLKRGQYDQLGEVVEPGVLTAFAGLPQDGATRLDLARWLTHPNHPLTARVAMNRYWEMLFGTGLVETVEDFGVQGALPSHPELLDWLALEFMDRGWNLREMLKLITLSATYRQSSHATPQMLEADPRNRLLGRGPRFRLAAESVRDNALAISGLLVDKVGGPSVKPYQPEGLWEDVSVERREKYAPDLGDGLYRRGMYTFWKRTCPPPGMAAFDAPDRETCLVRRARTNTPLQSLVLLNDPTYVEAARKFAERVMLGASTDADRLDLAFRLAVCRSPETAEIKVLKQVLEAARKRFVTDRADAEKLVAVGYSKPSASLDRSQLAAWTTVTSLILNLDETITKP